MRVAVGGDVMIATSPEEGGLHALTRTAHGWAPLGFATTTSWYWGAIDYDAPTRTLVSAGGPGVSVFSIGALAPSAAAASGP